MWKMTDRELLEKALDVIEDLGIEEAQIVSKEIKARLAHPEKEWVNLTVEEIDKVLFDLRIKTMGITKTEDMVRAIEAKLKDKNDLG